MVQPRANLSKGPAPKKPDSSNTKRTSSNAKQKHRAQATAGRTDKTESVASESMLTPCGARPRIKRDKMYERDEILAQNYSEIQKEHPKLTDQPGPPLPPLPQPSPMDNPSWDRFRQHASTMWEQRCSVVHSPMWALESRHDRETRERREWAEEAARGLAKRKEEEKKWSNVIKKMKEGWKCIVM